MQALWTAIIVIVLWFILNRHRFGEHTLFIGDSNEVSRVVGINVDREKIKIFTLMGALAAVAAMMLTLENKNFFGNQGQGYLLLAIASVLIGGTSIFGGRATLVGTVFGCIIITMLEPGLVATGLTGSWVHTMRGLVFLTAIIFYFLIEEPQRRARFARRVCQSSRFGRRQSAKVVPQLRRVLGREPREERMKAKSSLAGVAAAALVVGAGSAFAQEAEPIPAKA